MAPNVKRSWAVSVLLSTKGQSASISVRLGDRSARVTGSPRLAPEVAGIDEIQRRVHLTEPALGHMQVKRRRHQARMAHQPLHHR